MPDKKQNPLIGAFRDAAPSPPSAPPDGEQKPEQGKTAEVTKAAATAPQAKTADPPKAEATPNKPPAAQDSPTGGKSPERPKAETSPTSPGAAAPKEETAPAVDAKTPSADTSKEPQGDKTPAGDAKAAPTSKAPDGAAPQGAPEGKDAAGPPKEAAPGKAVEGKGGKEPKDAGKPPKEAKPADTTASKKLPTEKDAATPPKKEDSSKATGDKTAKETEEAENPAGEKSNETEQHHFIPLSKIHDLPGTYVKDQPRADYSDMIQSIKSEGLKEPVILRQREDGEYQLVDGFHRMQAIKKAGMLEIKADVYDMSLKEASDYRRARHSDKPLPIPGKLLPPKAPEKDKTDASPTQETAKDKADEAEIPEDFKLPLTHEGQSEIITTLKVSEIHPFEGHPFHVKDDKDMMDLVDSIKKFGVLEPVVVIPRKAGGYEMISGHRRRRACELAGIATMPVIVRQLDRDEAVISMVDANLKRENISPMEKARAYAMKLEAMKHKAGRRTKEEAAALEASGKKPMRADEELAQQTGESRSNIQKLVRLNNLTPELQQMVEDKTLPVHTAADLSYLKKEEQAAVADAIQKEDKVPTGAQAVELKKASQQGELTKEKIEQAVAPTKREETPPLKITLMEEDLRPYFPDKRTTIPDVKRGVLEALDLRKKALERQKAKTLVDKGTKKAPEPVR